jgi:hypothetical protein
VEGAWIGIGISSAHPKAQDIAVITQGAKLFHGIGRATICVRAGSNPDHAFQFAWHGQRDIGVRKLSNLRLCPAIQTRSNASKATNAADRKELN